MKNRENKLRIALRRLRAEAGGYFWLPCPNCGRMFAGYECGSTLWDEVDPVRGKMTCNDPECMEEVERRNQEEKRPGAIIWSGLPQELKEDIQ